MNVVQAIRNANRSYEHHTAIIDGDRHCSYGELLGLVTEIYEQLRELGIGPDDRIGFHCGDGLDYIAGALALLETGAAMIPLAANLTPAEAGRNIELINATGVLAQIASAITRIPNLGDQNRIGTEAGETEFIFRRRTAIHTPPYDDRSAPAFISCALDATNDHQGVILGHETILQRIKAVNQGLQVTHDDRVLWVLPMSRHFVTPILLFLQQGASVIVAHRDFPASITEIENRDGVTLIYAAPLHYHLLASDPIIKPDSLHRVRMAVSTTFKLPLETAEVFYRKFGFAPSDSYGLIEVGLPFINRESHTTAGTSVGRILPAYEFRLLNPDDNGVGEILLRGPGMFDGYFHPWRQRRDCLQEGWFKTNDLGQLDEEGRLHIVGHSKPTILCAGMKVSPEEVERVLNSHPQVRESLVYGVEQGPYGQIPQAAVVPTGPLDNPQELWRALRRHCYAALSSYKVPKQFTLAKKLVKTASGDLVRQGPPEEAPLKAEGKKGDLFGLSSS